MFVPCKSKYDFFGIANPLWVYIIVILKASFYDKFYPIKNIKLMKSITEFNKWLPNLYINYLKKLERQIITILPAISLILF